MPKLIFINNTEKAQHARQAIRRLVGQALAPHLRRWKLHGQTRLEIGPAEIAALRLLVENEWRRRTEPPKHRWIVRAQLETGRGKIGAEMAGPSGIENEEQAYQLVDQLMQQGSGWQVESVGRHEVTDKPAPPFTTSTLLQAASEELDFLPGRTEQAAQALYKARLITHPHTASAVVSSDAQKAALKVTLALYGQKYTFPLAQPTGEAGTGQAIRPTNIPLHPDLLRTGKLAAPRLSDDARQLYNLVWRRFIASQMTPASCQITTVTIRPTWTGCVEPWEEPGTYSHPFVFQAYGREVIFDGHLRVWPEDKSNNDENDGADLSALEKGTTLRLDQISVSPRPIEADRYSTADLVAALEETGIGRPETYAEIIESLIGLGYLRQERDRLVPTRLGEDVLFVCLQRFPEAFTTDFAAAIEKDLDQVASGVLGRKEVINRVYTRLIPQEEPPAVQEFPFPDHPKELAS